VRIGQSVIWANRRRTQGLFSDRWNYLRGPPFAGHKNWKPSKQGEKGCDGDCRALPIVAVTTDQDLAPEDFARLPRGLMFEGEF
jgi:hypothetical protein